MTNSALVDARRRSGKSQIEVAEALGVSKSTLNRWEQEKTFPHKYHRRKLCYLFGKTEQELGLLRTLEELGQTRSPFDAFIPNLPDFPFVGRDRELTQLKKHLIGVGGQNVALTALNGIPGVGKTALAVALAHDEEIREHFKDGILWAGLGPDVDLQSHLNRWGTLLGLTVDDMGMLSGPEAWAVALREKIGERSMLLVIDDVWALDDALALQVGGPNCAHLLTTRFPAIASQGRTTLALEELQAADGLALLNELAPRAVAQDEDRARGLVALVGGLPLALQLLGNHLRRRTATGQSRRVIAALDALLDRRVRMDLSEPRPPTERHPSLSGSAPVSLRNIIDVTVQQLDRHVQKTLVALAVFSAKPATFSEEAALIVADCSVETLDELADTGLLESSGERYTLHQTIADYARLQLQEDKARIVEERLLTYVEQYVREHQESNELLEAEIEMILAALERASQAEQHEQSFLRIVRYFAPYMVQRGFYQHIEPYLYRAYDIAKSQDDVTERVAMAQYLEQYGQALVKLGKYAQARTYLQEGLALAQTFNDAFCMSLLLRRLGSVAMGEGNYLQAIEYLEEGLEYGRQLQNLDVVVPCLINLGISALYLDNYDPALSYLQESLALARQLNHPLWTCLALVNVSTTAIWMGLYEQAETYVQQGLEVARQIGHTEGTAVLLDSQAWLLVSQGHYRQASLKSQEELDLARQMSNPDLINGTLVRLAECATCQGEYMQAQAYLQECLTKLQQNVEVKNSREVFVQCASLALQEGNYKEALRYCQAGIEAESAQRNADLYFSILTAIRCLASVFCGQTLSEEDEADMQKTVLFTQNVKAPEYIKVILGLMGECELRRGNHRAAEHHLEHALAIANQTHRDGCKVFSLALLGEIAIAEEDYHRAKTLLHQGQLLARQQDVPGDLGRVLLMLGELSLKQHQPEAAYAAFQKGLLIIPQGNQPLRAQALFGLARVQHAQGRLDEAKKQGGATLEILEAIGHYQAPMVRAWYLSIP